MKLSVLFLTLTFSLATVVPAVAKPFEVDLIPTSSGDLKITFVGHGTLMLEYGGKVIHIDPYGKLTNYRMMPKADLILITHEHRDHLDLAAITDIRKRSTLIVASPTAAESIEGSTPMENWDEKTFVGILIEAVPAYNVVHKRNKGEPFHPKGVGNGYVLTFADKRVYIAGDTENIVEMKGLGPVDIAFLPANLPYTMTPEMAAEAARWIKPQILYPYHYGETDVARISELLNDQPDIEVRIRSMK